MGYGLFVKGLNKRVKKKVILNDINLKVKAGSFVAIVGVSGAGKTSLLNTLSGYDLDYTGSIYYDSYDMKHNDLRREIAYVPQNEILHPDLTLYRELYYGAKIRMRSGDYDKRIGELISILGLTGRENTRVKDLSGGEKKRLSIALELLNSPKVLILDEPTSGLDLNVEKKLMELLKDISLKGTTVIVSLHTVSNLDLCDEIIFMGLNGSICYQGSYDGSLEYFGVNKFVDIYELLLEKTTVYNDLYNKSFEDLDVSLAKYKGSKFGGFFKNIITLAQRYVEIIFKDKLLLFMLLFQGFIIALLTNMAIGSEGMQNYDMAKITLFAATCAAMWTGLFNSIQEVVKERNVVKKEYISGVNISSYIISKLLVLFGLCFIQSIIFISTLYMHFSFSSDGLIFDSGYVENVVHFFLISYSSSVLGLFISSIFKRQEVTLIIATIYMMLQLIMSGVLLKLSGFVNTLSHLIIGRYAMELFGSTSNLISVVKSTKLNGMDEQISINMFMDEAKEYYTYSVSHITDIWLILFGFSFILIILTIMVLHFNIKKEKSY